MMRVLFFDMEFADGLVPGSIYSVGYLITDEEFHILTPPTDCLINPESTWNAYVEENILAYPRSEVESAPPFSAHYDFFKELFSEVDVAVGFSVGNDNRALKKDCERYGLPPISYRWFDLEKLCRMMKEYPQAHGLDGYLEAWCKKTAENRHRSDGDAQATKQVFEAICNSKHATVEMMLTAYPECGGQSLTPVKNKPQKAGKRKSPQGRKRKKDSGTLHADSVLEKENEKELQKE